MQIDQNRVRAWTRADGVESQQYTMSVDELVNDADELRAAVRRGMRLTIHAGAGPKAVTSLAFLGPVIEEIRDLRIGTINRVTDVELLAGAVNLRSLNFAVGSCAELVDLSRLPHLEAFGGIVTRAVASALQNPGLRYLNVEGVVPKSFARVAGPVERFEQEGGRAQVDLPVFAQPEAMRSITRIGPASFDLGQLSEMTGLTELTLSSCGDVVSLPELHRLPDLTRLTFKGCTTREAWEDVPVVSQGLMLDLSPHPSKSLLAKWRRSGWMIPNDPPIVPEDALTVEESGDGESWGVYMSRFEDLAEAVDQLDGSVPGGLRGEMLILGVVAELRGQGSVLEAEPDSEGSFTAVYFPNQEQAEQVFARAKDVLAADAATQLRYLRMAQA